MTTTQPLPSQGLTAQVDEDTMQMATSPYLQFDQEIDIDLDDNREHFIEDNSMIDDATDNMDPMQQDNLTTNHDDPMYEETADEDLLDIEDVVDYDYEMNPDDQGLQNTNVLAVDEASTSHGPQQQQALATLDPEAASITLEDLGQEPQGEAEDDGKEEQEVEVERTEEEEATNTVYINPDTLTDHIPHDSLPSNKTGPEPFTTDAENPPEARNVAQHTNPDEVPDSDTAHHLKDLNVEIERESEARSAPATQAQVDTEGHKPTEVSQQDGQETAASLEVIEQSEPNTSVQSDPLPSHLHPVIVTYMDQDYSLFPPDDHDDGTTFLLSDSALASQSFEKLLVACRELIADGLGHDDEMVLDIPALGLHICEDSKYASNITLAQVIDTYMLLSQNERLSSIQPLYCRLSHRVCLESQMAYLLNSAREGKSFTTIAEEHMGSPDEEQDSEEHGDATTYYETEDVLDDQEALNISVEIEESEKALTHEHEDEEEAGQDKGALTTDIAKPVEPVQDEEAAAEFDTAVLEGSEVHPPDAPSPQVSDPDPAEQEDDAASNSSRTVEDDHVATVPAELTRSNETAADQHDQDVAEKEHDFEEEEDLFADEDLETETALLTDTDNGNQPVTEVEQQNSHLSAEAEDELIEWDNEDEQQNAESVFAPPATPSKNVNSKRKLEEEEDYIIDLEDTPNAKRTRSS